jgi:hypothetical protein
MPPPPPPRIPPPPRMPPPPPPRPRACNSRAGPATSDPINRNRIPACFIFIDRFPSCCLCRILGSLPARVPAAV